MGISRRSFLIGGLGAGAVALGADGVRILVSGDAAHRRAAVPATTDLGTVVGRPATPSSAAPTSTTRSTTTSSIPAQAPADPSRGILVVVTLYGGNDGLNTVVPVSDAVYRSARGPLALDEHATLPLVDGLALHPSLAGLAAEWSAGRMAIVRGVGYPDPVRSHFRSMDIWQTGRPDRADTTGWLGRWLDLQGGHEPLLALSTTPTLPLLLQGRTVAGAALLPGNGTVGLGRRTLPAYRTMFATPADGLAGRIAGTGVDLLTVADELAAALRVPADTSASDPAAGTSLEPDPSPAGGELVSQMSTVARLIAAGAPTRVFATSLGGFDTHTTELEHHAALLAELDRGLDALRQGLAGTTQAEHVVVMVHSEFGRRVAANASLGTDHGTAAPVLVIGAGVRGGFLGDEPSLTALVDGDLQMTVDFRSIYADLLAEVLGSDPTAVLGAAAPGPIGLLR